MSYVNLIQASNASPDRKVVLDQIDRAFRTVPIASMPALMSLSIFQKRY